jgi:hypothetical protein
VSRQADRGKQDAFAFVDLGGNISYAAPCGAKMDGFELRVDAGADRHNQRP